MLAVGQAERLTYLTLPSGGKAVVDRFQEFASASAIQIPLVHFVGARSYVLADDFGGRMDNVAVPIGGSGVTPKSHRSTKEASQPVAQPGIDLTDANGGAVGSPAIFPSPDVSVASAFSLVDSSGPDVIGFASLLSGVKTGLSIIFSICGVAASIPVAFPRTEATLVPWEGKEFLTALFTHFWNRAKCWHVGTMTHMNSVGQYPVIVGSYINS